MKILVTHVPAGSGHEKAAEAICIALRQVKPEAETILLNGLEGMSATYQWAFTQGYLDMINRWPFLWGMTYHLLDLRGLAWAAYKLHRLSNASHGKILEQIVLRHRPDVFIGTHFFPMEVVSYLKQKGKLSAKLITVITDTMPHAVWISPGIDAYVVGLDLTKQELVRRGVPAERVQVLGIPIDPKFGLRPDRKELAQRLGLDSNLFTLLICSGGYGTGPMEQMVESLRKVPERLQALVVTGKNTALFHRLENARAAFPHALKVFGFIDNMDELMSVSDLLITKPGGLSCTEALAKGLPMVLTNPIPGQEQRNGRIIERMGAAIMAGRVERIPKIVRSLRSDPARLQEMKRKALSAARPDAAMDTAKFALS